MPVSPFNLFRTNVIWPIAAASPGGQTYFREQQAAMVVHRGLKTSRDQETSVNNFQTSLEKWAGREKKANGR
jgi:hypothetical protein